MAASQAYSKHLIHRLNAYTHWLKCWSMARSRWRGDKTVYRRALPLILSSLDDDPTAATVVGARYMHTGKVVS